MSYKSILQILLILAIISTICISIMKPKMHNPVIVYNSKLNVENNTASKIDEQNLPVMVQNTNIAQNTNNIIPQNQNNLNINQIPPSTGNSINVGFSNNIPTSSQNIGFFGNKNNSSIGFKSSDTGSKTANVNTHNTHVAPATSKVKNIKSQSNVSRIDLNRIVQNNQKIINTPIDYDEPEPQTSARQSYEPPKNIPPKTSKPTVKLSSNTTSQPSKFSSNTQSQPVTLTAQQEEIAWNKWRSNLNNQIMRDSKLPTMPNGTIFKYRFTVDKYGKVSNVQTSSITPAYTPYAIQFIAPVIRSYQGRSILNFPAGSRRVTTTVSGAWRISNTSKYSTPNDYHDVEKINN